MLTPDTVLQNRYQIVRTIGKGGMGAVYLARDTRLGNTVALKETFFTEDALRRAFEREARLLAGLRHAALPRVFDHFAENEGQFLVMEYVGGSDLETLLVEHSGPFPLNDVLDWADQLLDALHYLHTQDPPVIHRDIKPQNLKLFQKQVTLLDFGLAKGNAAGMTQTSGKSLYGYTPAYAPLEQIRDSGTDPRSDLYSLGVTIYHLLTGAPPADALARVNAVLGGRPDPLLPAHKVNPEVPPAVGRALQQAVALHSDKRAASALVLRHLLRNARLKASASSDPMATAVLPADFLARQEAATMLDQIPTLPLTVVNTALPKTPTQRNSVTRTRPRTQIPKAAPNPPQNDTLKSIILPRRLAWAAGGVVALLVLAVTIWAVAGRPDSAASTGNGIMPVVPQQFAETGAPTAEPAGDAGNPTPSPSANSVAVTSTPAASNPAPATSSATPAPQPVPDNPTQPITVNTAPAPATQAVNTTTNPSAQSQPAPQPTPAPQPQPTQQTAPPPVAQATPPPPKAPKPTNPNITPRAPVPQLAPTYPPPGGPLGGPMPGGMGPMQPPPPSGGRRP